MLRPTLRPRPFAALVAAALGLLLIGAGTPSPASAADPRCPHHAGELKRVGGGVLWASGGSLWVCTAYYGDPPVSKRLGPWSKGGKLAFDGSGVAWTVRTTAGDGFADDRVWAANGPYGTWLKGLRPATGPAAFFDQEVRRIVVSGQAAAWITTAGEVMMAVQSPNGSEPVAVGTGTPGAAAPVVPGVTDDPSLGIEDVLSYAQGLRPLKASGHRLLIGRWTALDGAALAKTLALKVTGGDGDECGGVTTYRAAVRPVAGQPRVGATWDSDWTSTSRACRGL